jgi:hypothetical protein
MFVNFEAGALEKRIKSKRGDGPPVSLTYRLNARAIASSPRSPRAAMPPRHVHVLAMRCRLHVHHPLALAYILCTCPRRSQEILPFFVSLLTILGFPVRTRSRHPFVVRAAPLLALGAIAKGPPRRTS